MTESKALNLFKNEPMDERLENSKFIWYETVDVLDETLIDDDLPGSSENETQHTKEEIKKVDCTST